MIRFNLYLINVPENFIDFRKKLILTNSVLSDVNFVKVIDTSDPISLEATFYNKIKIIENVLDEAGNTNKIEYFKYNLYNFFTIHKNNKTYLMVINQPKSIKPFISFLKNIIGLNFYIKEIKLNIEDFLANSKAIELKVIKAKFTSVSLGSTANAIIEVSSTDNAIKDFDKFNQNRYRELVKTKIRLTHKSEDIEFEISKNGCFSFSLSNDRKYLSIDFIMNKFISNLN